MRNLLITFDYELFLGRRSGKADDCLIMPTRTIQKLFKPFGIKIIFFVDTTYLLTLKDLGKKHKNCAADFEKIANQIRELVAEGHYVFPHIHPHWLDSIYIPSINEFDLKNLNRYRFQSLEMAEREMVFGGSMEVLSEIIHGQFPNYPINAYRAGGWSIQPFGDIKPFFEKYGIEYDFSVMSGVYQFSNAQYFDFSVVPDKPIYKFTNDITQEDINGQFTQVSSSVIELNASTILTSKIMNKILHLTGDNKAFGKGKGQMPLIIKGITPHSAVGKSIYDPKYQFASMELMNITTLPSYLKYLKENDFMHFVSHPKMLNKHCLFVMKKFLESASKGFKLESDFLKIIEQRIGAKEIK